MLKPLAVVLTLLAGLFALPAPAAADAAADAEFSSLITVRNRTFYPLVHEGFKDRAVLEVDTFWDDYEDLRATVHNQSGAVIRTLDPVHAYVWNDEDGFEREWWELRWNGKRADGTFAAKGTFTIVVQATARVWSDEQSDYVDVPVTARRDVVLDGGYMNRRFRKVRHGVDTASRSKGRGCYFDRYERQLGMACWRGSSIQATWRFRVPANATKIRKEFYGDSMYDHGGRMSLTGARPRPTRMVLKARVTHWRGEWFETVEIVYTSRVKV